MLRALVVLLLLANLGVWVWQSGSMSIGDTAPPRTEVEPERVRIMAARLPANAHAVEPAPQPASDATNQVEAGAPPSQPAPASPTAEASSGTALPHTPNTGLSAAAAKPPEAARCMEAGPFAASDLPALKTALNKTPAGLIALQSVTVKGTWLIYMGPFTDPEALDRKRAELRRMRDLSFEDAKGPATLVPGLVLGRFNQEAAARNALETMRQRGIRTARVVVLKPPQELTVARAAQVAGPQAAQLQALSLPAGRSFKACEG